VSHQSEPTAEVLKPGAFHVPTKSSEMQQESLLAGQHRREGFALVRGANAGGLISGPLAND